MKRQLFCVTAAFCLIWLFAASIEAQVESTRLRPQKVKITAVSARLFYDSDGYFSGDVFSGKVNLWNTVMEGASREGSSVAMLVVVETEAYGEGHSPENQRVELTTSYRIEDGTKRGRPAYFRRSTPFYIRENPKAFAGFGLYETGCYPVVLRARIAGTKQVVSKTVNLGCGE